MQMQLVFRFEKSCYDRQSEKWKGNNKGDIFGERSGMDKNG